MVSRYRKSWIALSLAGVLSSLFASAETSAEPMEPMAAASRYLAVCPHGTKPSVPYNRGRAAVLPVFSDEDAQGFGGHSPALTVSVARWATSAPLKMISFVLPASPQKNNILSRAPKHGPPGIPEARG